MSPPNSTIDKVSNETINRTENFRFSRPYYGSMFDIGSGPASWSPFMAVRNFHEGHHHSLYEQYF